MKRKVRIQDRNGVKVRIHEHPNGTTVEATCQCFGSPLRTHSTEQCPLFRAQRVDAEAEFCVGYESGSGF